MTAYEQHDERGPYFASRWDKRYRHDGTPVSRLVARLQAESCSLPPATRATLDDHGTLTLESRHGDVEVIPNPDSWTFKAACRRIHAILDAR